MFFHKRWTESETVISYTWSELKAIHLELESFSGNFIDKNALWLTYNQNYVKIIQKSSTKSH